MALKDEAPVKVHFITDYRRYTATIHPAGEINPKDKGARIEFHNGHYSTADKDKIKFLRQHDDNEKIFYELPPEAGKGDA
jgi:hypothetical protein